MVSAWASENRLGLGQAIQGLDKKKGKIGWKAFCLDPD
jgi:hypothetical protein